MLKNFRRVDVLQKYFNMKILQHSICNRPSLIAGLNCGLDQWTGLLDWITGSNQTASKSDDACVVHATASKAEV